MPHLNRSLIAIELGSLLGRPRTVKSSSEEAHLNLEWLRYVGYILAGCSLIVFITSPFGRGVPNRNRRIILYVLCVGLACSAFSLREKNAALHSPHKTVTGSVITVTANRNSKSQSIYDDFQLRLQDGSLTPVLTTTTVASDESRQPIHKGDRLLLEYRVWDNVPLQVTELTGKRPGWSHHQDDDGGSEVFIGIGMGIFGVFYMILKIDNNKPQPSPVQGLGL